MRAENRRWHPARRLCGIGDCIDRPAPKSQIMARWLPIGPLPDAERVYVGADAVQANVRTGDRRMGNLVDPLAVSTQETDASAARIEDGERVAHPCERVQLHELAGTLAPPTDRPDMRAVGAKHADLGCLG